MVDPGTSGTLKYDALTATPSGIQINTQITNQTSGSQELSRTFETIAAAGGITVPELMRALSLAPIDASHGADNVWLRNHEERLPLRGGFWNFDASAGVFALYFSNSRTYVSTNVGFRSAFVNL